jgi:hypothetical protein
LNRFISKLTERSLSFFTILRGFAKVEWGAVQQKVFDDLKNYLEQLPTLSSQSRGNFSSYVSATHSAVSGALVVEKEFSTNGKTAKQ